LLSLGAWFLAADSISCYHTLEWQATSTTSTSCDLSEERGLLTWSTHVEIRILAKITLRVRFQKVIRSGLTNLAEYPDYDLNSANSDSSEECRF
jgi:hypothetical protein